MASTPETSTSAGERAEVWRALLQMARPFRRQFAVVALLALMGTVADLIEPMLYRAVVNDIAGLFVEGGDIARQNKVEARAIENGATKEEAKEQAKALIKSENKAEEKAEAARKKQKSEHAKPEPATQPATAGDSAITAPQTSGADGTEAAKPADGKTHHAKTKLPHQHGHVSPRTGTQALQTLLWAVAILLVLNVAAYWFQLLADQRTTMLACRMEQNIIVTAFEHTLRLPVAFFGKRSSGALTKQIDQLDQVSPIITAFAQQLAPEVIRLIGILAIMLTQSWRLTLLALITLPPYLLVVRLSTRRLESGLDSYYEMWEGITSRIQDALGAIKTVKLSGAEPRESGHLRGQAGAAFSKYVDRNMLANRYLLWQTSLTYISQAIVLGYGGFLVLERQLTPGDVVMFVAYLDKLYSPIDELSSLSVSLQEHLASLRRALKLMNTPGAERGGELLKAGPGTVEFRNIDFHYSPERQVLHGVSFAMKPGTVTALVGPSGAGKTTLADMLLKLYAPSGGQVLIDGQPLDALDSSSVRAAIGVVAADGAIFRGSIAHNIRYKRPDASDEDVRAAAQAAGLSAMLQRMPEGIHTEVGERGMGLSVGERQRVQIARVLVGQPRVLVLDEATANLDYATENDIRRALLHAGHRPTTLVIAHRYSMVKDADQVIVLEAGRIIAQGTPAELAAQGGWFGRFASGADEEEETEDAEEEEEVAESADEDAVEDANEEESDGEEQEQS